MMNRSSSPSAHAVVLTHRRPRLATQVVRHLLDQEGFLPSRVHLVINGEGGLEDAELQRSIDTVFLPENLGASGGFKAGLERVARSSDVVPWLYVCEDDVGLFTNLPLPRVNRLIERAEAFAEQRLPERIGAIVIFGRELNRRTGIYRPYGFHRADGFDEADMGSWGATLISRAVLEDGMYPDPSFFWGLADLEYFLRIREAGFLVLVDGEAESALAEQILRVGRTWVGERPNRREEPWCAYYYARNLFELRRRHGTVLWSLRHLTKCVRRFQLAPSSAHRRAIMQGWWDGVRGRMGKNPAFVRTIGEFDVEDQSSGSTPRSGGRHEVHTDSRGSQG